MAQTTLSVVISPAAPSSVDVITMAIHRGVANYGSSARVSQENNRINVVLGSVGLSSPIPVPPISGSEFTYVELGKLPAGGYLVDVNASDSGGQPFTIATGIPLVVSEGRSLKTGPWVQLNYADHWWNPAESGWGLFIWHDKLDRVLAAWFTYGSDNKAEWYTIQAGRWVFFNRYEGQIIKTTGPAFSAFVPGSAVQLQVVGSASIGFTDANNGVFTYTLGGVTQSKNITRFKP